MHAEALESLLLRELLAAWRELNGSLFSQGMRPPALELSDSIRTLGSWERHSRTMALSRRLMRQESWSAVLEVLKHEMAHQYVDEVLQVHDETAHGPAFQQVCQRRGIDPSASGIPEAGGTSPRIVRKVQRLLALAESPNPNEAQSAMRAARRLMLRYNIDHAGSAQGYGFRQIGPVMARRPVHHKLLAGILVEHFFVSAIWIHAVNLQTGARGRALEIAGTAENLEIATWVHGYILETADRLWQNRPRGASRGSQGRFLAGVMLGFQEHLTAQAQVSQEAGLIWLGDADLDRYVRTRHPRQRAARSSRIRQDRSMQDGRQAGKQIRLHKPIRPGSDSPRQLTDGRMKRPPGPPPERS